VSPRINLASPPIHAITLAPLAKKLDVTSFRSL
jgi:hypothetical protein